MERVASCACSTMVRLPVPAGTLKVTTSPTFFVPNACTWPGGSALATTGREHCAGVQAASGTQTFPSVGQQPYPCRHCGSEVQDSVQNDSVAIGVQAPEPQAAESVHVAVQNPPANPCSTVSQVRPLAQSVVVRHASPMAL